MTHSRKIKLSLFFLLLFSYSYTLHKPNWNDLSRYDLIRAIIEKGTVSIDEFSTNTGDRSVFRGHYFSDKAPGVALAGIPVYWIVNHLFNNTEINHRDDNLFIGIIYLCKLWLVLIAVISFPSALFGVLLFDFLTRLKISERFALWLTLGYCLGTFAFPFSTLFFGHQFAAICIFTTFDIIYFVIARERSNRGNLTLLGFAGFIAGYAVITEYPAILLIPLLFIYLWLKEKSFKYLRIFILGMVIPALVLLYYNYLCSGNFLNMGYFHEDISRFNQEMSRGIAGVTYPKLSALWEITFSLYRGLFTLNPFLFFAIPGYFYMYRQPAWRQEFWLSVSVVTLFLLFNSSYYMWWGGWSNGPRHLIPIIPFLVLPIAFLPRRYWNSVCLLILVSIILMWVGTVSDPQVPETQLNPVYGYAFTQFIQGKFSLNLVSLIPTFHPPANNIGRGIIYNINLNNHVLTIYPQNDDIGIYLMGIIMVIWIWILIRKTSKEPSPSV